MAIKFPWSKTGLQEKISYWRSKDPAVRKLAFRSSEQDKKIKELEAKLEISQKEQEARTSEIYEDVKHRIELENAQRIYEGLVKAASDNPIVDKVIKEASVGSDLTRLNMYVLSHPDAQEFFKEIHRQAVQTNKTIRRTSMVRGFAVAIAALGIAGAYISSKVYDRKYVGNTLDNIESRVEQRLTATTTNLEAQLTRIDTTKLDASEFKGYTTEADKNFTQGLLGMKTYGDEIAKRLTERIEETKTGYKTAVGQLENKLNEQGHSSSTNFTAIQEQLGQQSKTLDKYGQAIEKNAKEISYQKDKADYLLLEDAKARDNLGIGK